jgi:molybdopterin molybdotransferase
MAQLSDDCFAFGGELMRADEAIGILAARVVAPETVALTAARGCILAALDHLAKAGDEIAIFPPVTGG